MAFNGRFSGKAFFFGFLAGAKKIVENQHELNKINVYPVPDGDTGANLAATVRHIMDRVRPDSSYRKTIEEIADAALEGAVGNSGIIFAQYLYGLSRHSRDDSLENFISSLKEAVKVMTEAVAKPVEGTMITVIRDWAEYLENHKDETRNWLDLWVRALGRARQSLSETTQKLDVLARAHVVDAGAKGMVHFLEGVVDFLKKPSFRKAYIVLPSLFSDDDVAINLPETVAYRYCTETILKGRELDPHRIRESVQDLGDSLAVAGSGGAVRVHMHTDQPAVLFQRLGTYGILSNPKADDMRLQLEAAHRRKWKIALLTDSSCDLPPNLFDQYQIHMVPLHLFFGENQYLDKITIVPDQFYGMLDRTPVYPTTSQPSVKTFQTTYSRLASHYDSVIALHLTGKFSGTYANSLKAAERVAKETGKPIHVVDSEQLSGTLGLLVLKTARAVAQGLTHAEIIGRMREWISKTRLYVNVKTLRYMVRSGRVSPLKGRVANWLNLKPIVSMENGGSKLIDKSFGWKSGFRKMLKRIARTRVDEYCVLHAHNHEYAAEYASNLEKLTGKKAVFTLDISPAIGLHAGIGCVAVGLIAE